MWEEDKHPRDEDGKFTNGSPDGREFRQNTSYEDVLQTNYNHIVVYGFADNKKLNMPDHLQHAKDMGYKNSMEYQKAAIEYWYNGEGKIYKNRKNEFAKVDEKTRKFLVVTNDGVIKTFFIARTKNKIKQLLIQKGFNYE